MSKVRFSRGGRLSGCTVTLPLMLLLLLLVQSGCRPDPGPVPGADARIELGEGATAPLYFIQFDKHGTLQSKRTHEHLLEALRAGDHTDVFLISHGWNNTYEDARAFYRSFLTNYEKVRRARGVQGDYRPLFLGVIWPSTALVFPWEQPPVPLAPGSQPATAAVTSERQKQQDQLAIEEVAAEGGIDPAKLRALFARGPVLTPGEREELARFLQPLYAREDENLDVPRSTSATAPATLPTAENLIALWLGAGGRAPAASGMVPAGAPLDALRNLDPRWVVRATTVLIMKDRAGTVGANGVSQILTDILKSSNNGKVHLIGHSYGCRVLLSALCARPHPRKVNSVLLLQPAISHLAFARQVRDGKDGGYRIGLDRSEQPILSTFSREDVPLHRLFHLFVRRASDLGETLQPAAAPGRTPAPPSQFAALGGYGPRGDPGAEWETIEAQPLGSPYPWSNGVRIFGIDSTGRITGHGKIDNETTWWLLYSQILNSRTDGAN